jgi:hypothetical protein
MLMQHIDARAAQFGGGNQGLHPHRAARVIPHRTHTQGHQRLCFHDALVAQRFARPQRQRHALRRLAAVARLVVFEPVVEQRLGHLVGLARGQAAGVQAREVAARGQTLGVANGVATVGGGHKAAPAVRSAGRAFRPPWPAAAPAPARAGPVAAAPGCRWAGARRGWAHGLRRAPRDAGGGVGQRGAQIQCAGGLASFRATASQRAGREVATLSWRIRKASSMSSPSASISGLRSACKMVWLRCSGVGTRPNTARPLGCELCASWSR